MKNPVALGFTAVFGVNPGYAHANGLPENVFAAAIVAAAWQKSVEEEFASTKCHIGAAVSDCRVVYNSAWGCPPDGEVAAVVAGNSNAKFESDLAAYKAAVVRVVAATKRLLSQERVQIAFHEVPTFVYLEPEGSGGEQKFGE
ncbi:MAG: hypothetical protein Q7S34_00565 [bacterium]|nr:hypothetical protein [bacterium]